MSDIIIFDPLGELEKICDEIEKMKNGNRS